MGTHPSNPSKDIETGRTLLELVTENQALLSSAIVERYGPKLPFLFKVLSIQKALSIQAHPDKKLAERLHREDPKNYPGIPPPPLVHPIRFVRDRSAGLMEPPIAYQTTTTSRK